jgi:hypothetical protein
MADTAARKTGALAAAEVLSARVAPSTRISAGASKGRFVPAHPKDEVAGAQAVGGVRIVEAPRPVSAALSELFCAGAIGLCPIPQRDVGNRA